jgi:NitT/TauT family transport system permease protein
MNGGKGRNTSAGATLRGAAAKTVMWQPSAQDDGLTSPAGQEDRGQPRKPQRAISRIGAPAVRAALGPVAVMAIVIGLWYFVSYVALDPMRRFLLPPPQNVISAAFLTSQNLLTLITALGVTAEIAMAGLAIAIGAGLLTAIIMSRARGVERALYPYLVVLQTIPILAIVPLIGFWLGFGVASRIVVCVLISVFPIIASAHFGLKSITSPQRDLFLLHHASRLSRLVKLEFPAALPAMFTGFRIAAGMSVIGEIVGGFFFQRGPTDLGILLDVYVQQLNGPMLFGAIILSSVLGVVVFGIFSVTSALVTGKWKE